MGAALRPHGVADTDLRYEFSCTNGGFRAWVSGLGPGSWCCEVKDLVGKTRVVWFEGDERAAREVLGVVGTRLGCEFREVAVSA